MRHVVRALYGVEALRISMERAAWRLENRSSMLPLAHV
jgi:hypothetical protein